MTNNRKVVSKELEDKAANLGTILKERKIAQLKHIAIHYFDIFSVWME